jgi:hypothetical protein
MGNAMGAVPPPPKRSSLSPVRDDTPELKAGLTDESAVEMPLPSDAQTFFLGGVFALSSNLPCSVLPASVDGTALNYFGAPKDGAAIGDVPFGKAVNGQPLQEGKLLALTAIAIFTHRYRQIGSVAQP